MAERDLYEAKAGRSAPTADSSSPLGYPAAHATLLYTPAPFRTLALNIGGWTGVEHLFKGVTHPAPHTRSRQNAKSDASKSFLGYEWVTVARETWAIRLLLLGGLGP